MIEEIDFWLELDDAEAVVEKWPAWMQRVVADPFYG